MSYGYSGNMGFRIPSNWNLDQFKEISNINTGSSSMDLDKVTYSEKYSLVDYLYDSIITYIFDIRSLEMLYKDYKTSKSGNCSSRDILLGVTNFLRSFKYGNAAFYLATLDKIDNDFINYVKDNNINLYNALEKYASSDALALKDGIGGLIDIGHLAATVEGYIGGNLAPDFWFGWGGDLASLMNDVDKEYEKDNSKSHLEIASSLIGDRSSFGYMDICTDADAIKIAEIIGEPNGNTPFSNALNEYYINHVELRFSYYLKDLDDVGLNLDNLINSISNKMSGVFEDLILVPVLGKLPSNESREACNRAFAEFIIENYPII